MNDSARKPASQVDNGATLSKQHTFLAIEQRG